MTTSRRSVLVVVGGFPPAVKAGGPVKSVAGLTERLDREFAFRVITSARDLGERGTLDGIVPNRWVRVGRATVLYQAPGLRTLCHMARVLARRDYEVLYLNSFFSRRFSMFPLLLWVLCVVPRHIQLILAPRGEFSDGALSFKKRRKRLYIGVIRMLRIPRSKTLIWQASTPLEADDLARALGVDSGTSVAGVLTHSTAGTIGRGRSTGATAQVIHALDMASTQQSHRPRTHLAPPASGIADSTDVPPHTRRRQPKRSGELDLVFVSRISRMKNLLGVVKALERVSSRVRFWIYGPIEDKKYWRECQKEMQLLPPEISAVYCGLVSNDEAMAAFGGSHLFALPTYGENFGHVIHEALSAGCPVVVGRDTPWREVESAGAGWVVEPEDSTKLATAIQRCAVMDNEAWSRLETSAIRFVAQAARDDRALQQNLHLFRLASDLAAARRLHRRASGRK